MVNTVTARSNNSNRYLVAVIMTVKLLNVILVMIVIIITLITENVLGLYRNPYVCDVNKICVYSYIYMYIHTHAWLLPTLGTFLLMHGRPSQSRKQKASTVSCVSKYRYIQAYIFLTCIYIYIQV